MENGKKRKEGRGLRKNDKCKNFLEIRKKITYSYTLNRCTPYIREISPQQLHSEDTGF